MEKCNYWIYRIRKGEVRRNVDVKIKEKKFERSNDWAGKMRTDQK